MKRRGERDEDQPQQQQQQQQQLVSHHYHDTGMFYLQHQQQHQQYHHQQLQCDGPNKEGGCIVGTGKSSSSNIKSNSKNNNNNSANDSRNYHGYEDEADGGTSTATISAVTNDEPTASSLAHRLADIGESDE
jgi:hypothetical protein